jgi:hypothetical protein
MGETTGGFDLSKLWSSISNLFGSGAGATGAAAIPAIGTESMTPYWQGQMAGASGVAGAGAPAIGTETMTPYWQGEMAGAAPAGSAAATATGTAGGTSIDANKLASALQGAGKSVGDVNKSQGIGPPKLGNPGQSQAIRGQGPSLNQLVQLLLQRQQGLYPGGGSSGQPQPASRTTGLLGF